MLTKTRFVDQFIDYAKEFTDCPPVFLRWGAYLAISAVLSRNVTMEMGSWDIVPNIWICLIGKSSSHKSTALSIVENLLTRVAPYRLASSMFSEEYIIKALSESPSKLFVFDEAKSFFDLLEKKYNQGLKSLFTTLYRKANFSRSTLTAEKCEITGAYLCWGGASTPEWLRASIGNTKESSLAGFLARFLMVPYLGDPGEPIPFPKPHSREKFTVLADQLTKLSLTTQNLAYSAETMVAFHLWYKQMSQRQETALPLLHPFFEHMKNEAIHKLSLIIAVDRGETAISIATLREATLALRHVELSLPELIESLSESDWDRDHRRLWGFISKAKTISRTELGHQSHITGQHLETHLKGFLLDLKIKIVRSGTAGRPVELITKLDD